MLQRMVNEQLQFQESTLKWLQDGSMETKFEMDPLQLGTLFQNNIECFILKIWMFAQ